VTAEQLVPLRSASGILSALTRRLPPVRLRSLSRSFNVKRPALRQGS